MSYKDVRYLICVMGLHRTPLLKAFTDVHSVRARAFAGAHLEKR